MDTVNPYFLFTLLAPITGLADDDDAVRAYFNLDSNDESQVKAIIREFIVPYSLTLSAKVQERVKLAYQYYLSKPDAKFEGVLDSILPPFDAPDDPRQFFFWVWEECFPGEDYRLADLSQFVENPDINEPTQAWCSVVRMNL